MAPAIINAIRSTITARLATRSDFASLSPLRAHAILTALGVKDPDSLDVLWMLREQPAR